MRLGIRTAQREVWWHSDLATPLNQIWFRAFDLLNARMPACTVAIQSAHQWIEAP
jgi:hypothetical protein